MSSDELGEDERRGCGPELTDERRAEQQSRGNLADDRRLSKPAGEAAAQLRRDDDHEQLHDEEAERPAKGVGRRQRR